MTIALVSHMLVIQERMEKMSELVKRTWRKHSKTRRGGMIGMLVNGSLRQVTKCWCYTSNNYNVTSKLKAMQVARTRLLMKLGTRK